MAANAKLRGFKATLSYDTAGGTSFTALGTIVDAIDHSASAEVIETSLLTDANKTFLKGQIDGGEVTFVCSLDPSGDETKAVNAMFASLDQEPNWKVSIYVNASTTRDETFKALVVGNGRAIKRGELVTQPITLKITGAAGFTTA